MVLFFPCDSQFAMSCCDNTRIHFEYQSAAVICDADFILIIFFSILFFFVFELNHLTPHNRSQISKFSVASFSVEK